MADRGSQKALRSLALVGVRGHRARDETPSRGSSPLRTIRSTPGREVLPTMVRRGGAMVDSEMIWIRRLLLVCLGGLLICGALLIWEALDGPADPEPQRSASSPRPLWQGGPR